MTADDECAEEFESAVSDSEKRVTIKYFYKEAGCPPEEDWSGRDGTIAYIRRRMGSLAPSIQMVRRTLHRLASGDEDVAVSNRGGTGRPRTLTAVDDLYIGLLLCEGISQTNATLMVNAERRELGLPEITRSQLQESEKRVALKRRRRRKHKSGSCDLESNWCKASYNQSVELDGRFRAGAALQGERLVILVGTVSVSCEPVDPWGLVGEHSIKVKGAWWNSPMPKADYKRLWPCALVGFVESYCWSRDDSTPAYVIENVDERYGTERYMMRADDVWKLLTQETHAAIETRLRGRPRPRL